ncbi:MAG: hypothetical protein IJU56_05935 [Clostridia bacterium]|nr:hypothetical protein [Clostridia bacterium]
MASLLYHISTQKVKQKNARLESALLLLQPNWNHNEKSSTGAFFCGHRPPLRILKFSRRSGSHPAKKRSTAPYPLTTNDYRLTTNR